MTDHARHAKAESLERRKAAEPGLSAGHQSSDEMTVRRKLAEAALRDSEERLRAILETAVEGIITIDERGIIESLNPAAEKIFGYEAQEVVGKNLTLRMPTPYRDEHDGYLANYLRTGRARISGIGREVVGLRKDGTVFPMDLSVSEVRLAHKRLFTGFVRDISDRKRLEKEVLQISDLEQRRIGQDLHDGLCQQLAGIELMSEVLEQNLSRKSKTEAAQAAKIAEGVRAAIGDTRMLARGLSPVDVESNGLMSALQELASNTEKLSAVGRKRILILDDHPMMREGLAQLIGNEADLSVCGEAENANEAIEKINALKPDLLLADITLPGKNGLELIKDVQALIPGL